MTDNKDYLLDFNDEKSPHFSETLKDIEEMFAARGEALPPYLALTQDSQNDALHIFHGRKKYEELVEPNEVLIAEWIDGKWHKTPQTSF